MKRTLSLLLAHIAHHEKGAEAYGAEKSQYGLSLTRLWGDDSGAFGYCVNDGMAMSLADAVKPGDHIKAYVYPTWRPGRMRTASSTAPPWRRR